MSEDIVNPLDLASDPVRIDFPEIAYDHKSQIAQVPGNHKLFTTWNRTRTYDYKGNPKDSDND